MATKAAAKRRQTHRNSVMNKITVQPKVDDGMFICCCCGKKYDQYSGNFAKSQSEIWAARDYYLPICRTCIDNLFEHYRDVYGDEFLAIKRICMAFDIYYDEEIVKSCHSVKKSQPLITAYISKSNLSQYKRGRERITYDTTLDKEHDDHLEKIQEAIDNADEQPQIKITQAVYNRWGVGTFEMSDYPILEHHYQMLHRNNPNIDNNQEIFIKTLCHLNLMMMQAMKDKDYDTYAKINDQYSKTFTKAGLKTVEEKDDSNNATLGVTLAVISQTTPEEFYKDKKLFEDYDALGDYFDRFVKRPMANLMQGTDVRDKEFYVPNDDDDDDDVGITDGESKETEI